MTAPHLIGVMGKKRHGKDALASRLVDAHGFHRLAFADPMRDALLRLDPIVKVEADETGPLGLGYSFREPHVRLSFLIRTFGWETAKSLREVRRLLQEYGTGIRDTVDSELWVRHTIGLASATEGPVVIPDVRFPNEVAAVREAGGLLVYVYRPQIAATTPHDLHPSETSVSAADADHYVHNGGSLEELFEHADRLVHGIWDGI